jgi:hypothetical protein
MSQYHRGRLRSAPVSAAVDENDNRLRGLLTRFIATTGRGPDIDELAEMWGAHPRAVRKALRRLEAKHGLLLHPRARQPWVVHPFSLSPSQCWVQGRSKGWWAPCLYCAFGVAGCVREDVVITARLGGEAEPVAYRVEDGMLSETPDVFHFTVPAKRWWDNVVHTCATFLPFRGPAEVERWCRRHGFEQGYTIPVGQLFGFALDWYLPHATQWRPRSPSEMRACFARHGLKGPFWAI